MTFCYGLAEATLMATAHRFRGLARSFNRCLTNSPVACVGKPVAGLEVRVGAGPNKVGPISIRGDSVFAGYLGAQRRPAHSWFDTQDFGYFVRGELHVCGRAQDRIFVNGEKLFAADVEAAIQRAVQVRGCVVLPHADEIHVLLLSPSQSDACRHVTESLIFEFGIKPTSVRVATPAEIVRSSSGKPMREATYMALQPHLV